MKKSNLQATTLRNILIVIIILLLGGSVAGFYYAKQQLTVFGVEVKEVVSASGSNNTSVQSLENLQSELTKYQNTLAKASSLVSNTQEYQGQVLKDVGAYATAAGLTVTYNFGTASVAQTSTTGFPSKIVTVTIAGPVSYISLLQFMHAIEGNLPKMQITGINLGRTSSGANNLISTDALSLEVYVQ